MIKDPQRFEQWDKGWKKREGPLPFEEAIRIIESLWQEGLQLGSLPPSDPLEGIETDIKIAKILNACLKNSSKR